MKKLLPISTVVIGFALCAPTQAEFSATVDIANLYLFRGINMSNGSAMIAGALDYTHDNGLYAGVWSTSGDDAAGVEVDYYLGFGGQIKDFDYQLQYLNYYYPNSKGTADAIVDIEDYAELSLALSYQGVNVSVTAPTHSKAAGEYIYYTLGYGYDAWSATLGVNAHEESDKDYTHLDVAYQFNEHISFVISQVLDKGRGSILNDATIWQANYSLPIRF